MRRVCHRWRPDAWEYGAASARRRGVPRRARLAVIAAAALALGAASWAWGRLDWPARTLVRGHLGDVAAAALVYAIVAGISGARRKTCTGVALAIAVIIELAQRHAPSEVGTARALTLGARFDPWDLVAYLAGVALAVAGDRGRARG